MATLADEVEDGGGLIESAGGLGIEVGGRGKGRRQFKGIRAGCKLVFAQGAEPGAGRLPLSLLGFLC